MTEATIEKNNKKDLSELNFNRIIELLYSTLEDDSAWNKFFHLVNDSIGSKYIHIYALDKQHATISWSNGNDLPAEGELDLLHKYQFIDPRAPFVFNLSQFNWFHDHEHFDQEFMANNQFYQEFFAPLGVKYLSACKILDNEQTFIVLGAVSSPKQGPLVSDSLAFLDRLVPHISRVCRLSIQKFIYSTQALVGTALINKLRQPVLLMTLAGDLVHINDATKSLLKSTTLVNFKNNQLVLPAKYHQAFFDDCVSMEYALKNVGIAQYKTEFKLLKVTSSKQAEALYVFYALLQPQPMMGVFGLRPLIMVFFYHPESAPKIDSTILTAAFGLTPSECRMAILLAKGLSQKDIAIELGLKHDTVRKQLQTIYQKTSTHQQTELVRLMLHLPSNFVNDVDNTVVASNFKKINK